MNTQFELNYNTQQVMSGLQNSHIPKQHNIIQHNKNGSQAQKNSSVRVVCRIKPLGECQEPIDMKIDKENAEISISQPRQQTTKTFTFNRIFTDETQGEFVPEVCRPILQQAFGNNQGYLVFSYGVTNSGKTHTILGSHAEPGILPYLVRKLSQRRQVRLSAIQLYNDQFFSLSNKQKLTPREMNGFLDFDQCSISELINSQNMEQKFKQYISNRTQNQTKLNSKSSRSHAIFRLQAGDIIIGVVDLAGSQRTNRVFASIDQTSNINKSLLCLGRCIKALNQNPESQLPIPYRQSKLTKVLIQYFAAKVEVLMIANINQSQNCFHQNMKVLDYAVLAKDIRHCNTQNSLKKSQFKFRKTNKVDVFEALYKSAVKSAHGHKSLKSSRSKMNEKLIKSNMKQTNTNQKFAKALKSQQLQMYIQKFQSSQQTFDYMIEYMHQKQLEEDSRRIQIVKQSQYQSPLPQPIRRAQTKEMRQIGIGRQQKSLQVMKRQISQQMKQQLRLLLEEERLAKMQNKQTCIGSSLQKISQKSIQASLPKQDQQISCTPQKQKSAAQQDSFIMKTSSAIYSSVKKILSKNVHSMKKIIPKFMKGTSKIQKLTICNYNQLYAQLFKFDSFQQQRSQFSFYAKIQRPSQILKSVNYKNVADFCTQTQNMCTSQWNKYDTQDTRIETDLDSDSHSHLNQICSNQSEIMIANTQLSTSEADKQNVQINQTDEDQSEDQQRIKQTEQKTMNSSVKNNLKVEPKARKGRPNKTKSKMNNQAQRVAQMRTIAARLCREQSRTPLKKRLRNHKNQ